MGIFSQSYRFSPGQMNRWAGRSGYVRDDEAGMVMMGARYYVPQLGRFLTQDPIGQEGGLNLYAYCGNSPLVSVDPDGRQNILIIYGAQGSNDPGDDPDIKTYSDRIAYRYESAGESHDVFMRVHSTEDALKYARWADRLVWIGHSDDGTLYMPDDELSAYEFSKARGGRRLESVDLVGCNTLVNPDRAAAWGRLSNGNLRGTYSSLPINLFSLDIWPFNNLAKYDPDKTHYRGLVPGFNWKGKKGRHRE
ncbi:hypothetical protein BH11ARM2_BH11ARM2_29630 [soil metagenome]